MKACVVTCHHALNHGARLQACALLHYLRSRGVEAEVADYRPWYVLFFGRLWYNPRLSLREWAKLFLLWRRRRDAVRRNAAFERFSQRNIPRTPLIYGSAEELRANPPQADIYIAGSDQIWNTTFRNGTDAVYYLDFGSPSVKRISYAASFGVPYLAEGCESFVREHLAAFDALSVREASGVDIAASLGFGCRRVADPVFLLSAEEWDAMLGCGESSEDYILVYDTVGSRELRRVAKRMAKMFGCRIYSAGERRMACADRSFSQAAPDKFVELVRNARCVVGNSYHGAAFAMIYRRDFFLLDREDGQNERMHDLLDMCGLSRRLITAGVSDSLLGEHVDYDVASEILQRHIAASGQFLKEALELP